MSIDEKIGLYLKSSGTGLISQVVTKLSPFATVWLLNRVLLGEIRSDGLVQGLVV
ncbi:hypothetical protein GGP84_002170 [Salinibacter ruber]|nr:hypothetical protein [Salinibacter ruber]